MSALAAGFYRHEGCELAGGTKQTFYRGQPINQTINHIVSVETVNGSRFFKRVALTCEQMAQLEAQLMERKHVGDIADYLISAAEDCTFTELTAWVDSFRESAEQQNLISIDQNTLFAGGDL